MNLEEKQLTSWGPAGYVCGETEFHPDVDMLEYWTVRHAGSATPIVLAHPEALHENVGDRIEVFFAEGMGERLFPDAEAAMKAVAEHLRSLEAAA